MTGLLPILEELLDCQTDLQRAQWLLACPFGILQGHGYRIKEILDDAGFVAGVEYVDLERVALMAVRDAMGNHTPKTNDVLSRARTGLRMAVTQ
ncbi:hypothetical protein LAV84_06835 [Rhizobium sp. VS19-DR104.2]|uniref:hypothetical protein n=1 Tax=unclassified Rhizobium TaxID=2613769 RepID=UPI001CC3C056|nr:MULTISPECIES: hypothetical protein [unclassified Rhizobium]MBZ5760262.1 hypothetical protein [Rhizobium sp. VS19-DR96]MBZ5766894.1 hypothetical protein [Rhizobium sp. VS19-DR129.2]MBZ5773113.1 hypothetical protein [Rhizobium sp. VS19-DRK62.2]MBZ5784097.1 hypothetical protein [Rhizobium sp. VS19-DR121]MBZ5802457.1 hypothetical protein [Rhizobium sp. VS19-DR181]